MDRTTHNLRRIGLVVALAVAGSCGCQTVKTPEEKIAKSNIPKEFTKVNMPDYVVEPPDLILVEVLEAYPGRPITGERLVRPDGKISLQWYGDVYVAGLTVDQIKEKIVIHLRQFLTDQALGLVQWDERKKDYVEVEPAKSNRVFVDVTAYNSKFYYVQGDVGSPGRMPITGNETVLDAINFAGNLLPTAANQNIRLVRPAPPGACCEQVLPVNLPAIINAGDTTTNYQIMPGDRLVVYRDPIVRTTVFIDRLAAPFNTVVNSILTYAFAGRYVKSINVPLTPASTTVNTGAASTTTLGPAR
ncbi:MAG TPA: polysaccharide biosynthesis/export family protein [Urbifossiella sp.]|nr:polysaccharide biosynthesis/export family protein [Urbifossiella sp.]